jgi:16S rRNA (guanine527-N7)-methyltransferase
MKDISYKVNSPEWRMKLVALCEESNLSMDNHTIELFGVFAEELLACNSKLNLTTITDPMEFSEKHILDSLIPARYIDSWASVLDIGTGGGFPGIPLKIYMPSLKVTLIDKSRKKVNFLKYVIRRLELNQILALQKNAEKLIFDKSVIKTFDVVISRAFTSLDTLISLALPVLKKNGLAIAMRGEPPESDIIQKSFINNNGIHVYCVDNNYLQIDIHPYRLPSLDKERYLILIRNLDE